MMFTAPVCDFQIPITPTESPSTRKFWDIQDFLPISHYFSSSIGSKSHIFCLLGDGESGTSILLSPRYNKQFSLPQ